MSPNDAQLLMDLFVGSDLAHGRTDLKNTVNAKGKQETRSWTEKRAVNLDDWKAHLAGREGIGIPPLNSKNEVRWGAIDVDVYDGVSLEQVNQRIQEHRLPLVVCRSKSGGPHIYLFLSDWVPAGEMIEKLDSFAGFLGFGTSEIFPKQAMIASTNLAQDFGSWINMPYFGGAEGLRYGLDQDSKALMTVDAFIAYVKSRTLTPKEFRDYAIPAPVDLFADGPPCLNSIMNTKPRDFRNVILSNLAVYAKKAHPDSWKLKVDQYNNLFPEPLGAGEVESIKKSYEKKDYRYQCSKQPLCNFCESSRCKQRKFGIGKGDFLPSTRSLAMVESDPPIWFLDIELPTGKRRISLTTEELQNPRLFQRRCMESIQQMPPSMKMEDWEPVVAGLMAHCTTIPVPEEMSPAGQCIEHIEDFMRNRPSQDSMEDVLRGMAYQNTTGTYFRLKDLWAYLNNQRFTALKQHQVIMILKTHFKADKHYRRIANHGVNLVFVPGFTGSKDNSTPLTPPKFDQKM